MGKEEDFDRGIRKWGGGDDRAAENGAKGGESAREETQLT